MDAQLNKMIKMLKLWLMKNELDSDTTFYSIEEWHKREEPYHNESEFVITTEGGLHLTLNYGDSAEFYDLLESFGYYMELGHSWDMGFYKNDIDNRSKAHQSYSEKLKDERWQTKRKFILDRSGRQCEDCNSKFSLEIHHCYYLYGYEPWEYPYDALRCLCKDCHKKRALVEQVLRGHLSSLKTKDLEVFIKLISTGFYWYPKNEIFSFLNSLSYDQEETKDVFSKLLTKRNSSA